MPTLPDCPGIECWEALFGDGVSADQRDRYEQHLETCPACQARLDQAEECGNPLLGLVRRVGDPGGAAADPTLVQVLETLHETTSPDRVVLDNGPTGRVDKETMRRPPFRRLFLFSALVVLLAIVGVGIPSRFATAQEKEKAAGFTDFYQDFRKQNALLPGLRIVGANHEELTTLEDGGYRLTLPAGRKSQPPLRGIGVMVDFVVSSNFQITGTYELVAAEAGVSMRDVVGVELFIMRGPDGKRMGRLGRFTTPKGAFYEVRDSNYAPGAPAPPHAELKPTAETRGQLRLVREGDVLSYLVKDETTKGEFKELFRNEFGPEKLNVVLFGVTPGQADRAVDARLIDLRIRSGGAVAAAPPGAPAAAPAAGRAAAPAPTPPKTESKNWGAMQLLALLIVLSLMIGLGVWLYRRQRRPDRTVGRDVEENAPALAEAAPPVVSFACPACGKTLKVKAQLGGKKVKCIGCGKAASVPASRAGEAGRVS